jgi:prepilin-type N-terminal cleavage/methylation domain-containing protein
VAAEQRRNNQRGFTLVEISIVVGLIALLIAIVVPSFIKVRKESQARRIVNDARQIDAAVNSWAMENGMADGDSVDITQASSYTKSGMISTNDLLGNPYTIGPVGPTQVLISAATKSALAGVSIDWGAY